MDMLIATSAFIAHASLVLYAVVVGRRARRLQTRVERLEAIFADTNPTETLREINEVHRMLTQVKKEQREVKRLAEQKPTTRRKRCGRARCKNFAAPPCVSGLCADCCVFACECVTSLKSPKHT